MWEANASSRCDSKSRTISWGDFPLGEPRGLNTQAHSEQPNNPNSSSHTKLRMTGRFYPSALRPQTMGSGNLFVGWTILAGIESRRLVQITAESARRRCSAGRLHEKAEAMKIHVSHSALLSAVFLETSLLTFGSFMASAQRRSAASQANTGTSGNTQTVGTMSDVMTSMVYPAANNILLAAYRSGPQDDKEWLAIQRSAVILAESGNVLMMRGPAGAQGDWAKDVQMLSEVGAAAYKAARAKDANALMAVAQPLNAACTTCHKQYRANLAAPGERVGPAHQPAE